MVKTAVLLIAHGSRIAESNLAINEIAAMVKSLAGYAIVQVSFLEHQVPTIQEGIDACVAQGAKRIMFVPYFLQMGAHVQQDLPEELAQARQRHPHVAMALGKHLGVHQRLAELVIDRVEEAFDTQGWR